MRLHIVIRYVALALLLNAIFMFISCGISAFNGDSGFMPLLYSAIVTSLFGLFPLIFVPATEDISNKEGLLIVVLSWMLSCLAGTMPYLLYAGPFGFTNAWFESVSGFTTTGSTILADIEILPAGILFWRAATHWIGGIGIIIFVLAVLPFLGIAEMVLFRSEISAMVSGNFHFRARRAIQILAGVYFGLTVLETAALMIFGMGFFDAITHSFATIATGGFSTKNSSIAYFNSPAIEIVIIIFMILSGIHFALLFTVVTGHIRDFFRSSAVRYYILSMLFAVIIITLVNRSGEPGNWPDELRNAAFNLISVGTSTGFASADTNIWPGISQLLLIFFGLQCACAGSTSGGIKADRVVMLFKAAIRHVRQLMHPNAIVPVRMDNQAVKDDMINRAVLFIATYIMIVFLFTVAIALTGVNIIEAFSGTVATMGNVGPGLGQIGSLGNFSQIPVAGKWLFSFAMLIGRLEIYAFFIFFTPAQWSKTVTY